MVSNPHQNMKLIKIWFQKGELNKLINAVECNEKEKVFDIIFQIKQRGDLK